MKPGELERNLSRLMGLAARARERLDSIEEQVSDLREQLEAGAAPTADDRRERDEDVIESANRTRAPSPAQAEVLFK